MKSIKFTVVIILVLVFLASLAGCGSTGGTPSPSGSAQPSASAAANAVTMKNYAFNPASITVKKGDTVTWTNEDPATHDVVADAFDSGNMRKGDTFSFTFNEAGTFDYECTLHSGMNGKVIVE